MIIGCYVDDLFTIYWHDNEHSIYQHSFTKQLMGNGKVEDEGPIADLLNIEITQSKDGKVKLAKTSYIEKFVATYCPASAGLPSHQAVKTPCDKSLVMHVADALSKTDEIDDEFRRRYQSLVGALLYWSLLGQHSPRRRLRGRLPLPRNVQANRRALRRRPSRALLPRAHQARTSA